MENKIHDAIASYECDYEIYTRDALAGIQAGNSEQQCKQIRLRFLMERINETNNIGSGGASEPHNVTKSIEHDVLVKLFQQMTISGDFKP